MPMLSVPPEMVSEPLSVAACPKLIELAAAAPVAIWAVPPLLTSPTPLESGTPAVQLPAANQSEVDACQRESANDEFANACVIPNVANSQQQKTRAMRFDESTRAGANTERVRTIRHLIWKREIRRSLANQPSGPSHVPGALMQLLHTTDEDKKTIANPNEQQNSDRGDQIRMS